MNIKQQLQELIKAQDIIRQVWVNHKGSSADKIRQLDKDLTKTINEVGKQ
jgi:hypothetical protein